METVLLERDIKVFYVKAKSFPEGIMDAHKQLCGLVPPLPHRTYFGISAPEDGNIVYRAAAEEVNPGEAEKLNCDTLLLRKGNYISLVVYDYLQELPSIENVFKKLLSHPDIDPQGYCVEWYLPTGKAGTNAKDVKCMVRLSR